LGKKNLQKEIKTSDLNKRRSEGFLPFSEEPRGRGNASSSIKGTIRDKKKQTYSVKIKKECKNKQKRETL